MLFITHDLGIVRKLAERVCVMKEGKIVEQGPIERVFTAPEHPYTRALLAAEPKPDPAPLQPAAARPGLHRAIEIVALEILSRLSRVRIVDPFVR